jgi:polyisoprenoid-binding protein YceI
MKALLLVALLCLISFGNAQTLADSTFSGTSYPFSKDSKILIQSSDFVGGFTTVQGRIGINDSSQVTGFELVIDVNSLFLNEAGMANHAKSSDFFDAAKYPSIRFFGTQIAYTDSTWAVTGNMTSKGITVAKTIPFQVKKEKKGGIKIEANFVIYRTEFHIGDPDAVSNVVLINTELFAKTKP